MVPSYEKGVVSILAGFLVAGSVSARGVLQPPDRLCSPVEVAGAVAHGQLFEEEFGPGLLFRLVPAAHPKNPQGWTIEVRSRQHPDHDYLMVATPPYRFSNPRYLDTSYGKTARQAVEWSPRRFRFVLTEGDYETLHEALEYLLWPGNYTRERVEGAEETWKKILASRTREGQLTMLDSRLGRAGADDESGRIDWLRFKAELCGGTDATIGGEAGP